MTDDDLKTILAKPGYGIASALKSTIKSALRERTASAEACSSGEMRDLEPTAQLESLQAERVSLNYSGKVRVGIKFYRRRLADYSRANSEKSYIDCAVYAALIQGDSENEIWLEDEGQFKVEKDEEERVELTFTYSEVDFDNLWVKAKKHGGR